jgi:hypothetical protein
MVTIKAAAPRSDRRGEPVFDKVHMSACTGADDRVIAQANLALRTAGDSADTWHPAPERDREGSDLLPWRAVDGGWRAGIRAEIPEVDLLHRGRDAERGHIEASDVGHRLPTGAPEVHFEDPGAQAKAELLLAVDHIVFGPL